MASRSLLKLFVFSTCGFETPADAAGLIALLADGPFAATRFDRAEPVRRSLAGSGRAEAAAMLSGAEGAGSVFLAGDDPYSTFVVAWRRGGLSQWYAEFQASLADRPQRCAALADALALLFTRFPARYAGVSPAADWKARHWLVREHRDGGETVTKVGLDLNRHLPGICWWTLFGAEATAFFGRGRLLAAPCARAIDLGAAGVALVADACPPKNPAGAPSTAEARLRDALGAEYFFDIARPRRSGPGVPGVTAASS